VFLSIMLSRSRRVALVTVLLLGLPLAAVVAAFVSGAAIDLSRWSGLAEQLERRGWVPGPNEFLFTSRWFESGHLARELGASRTVLCYNRKDSRGFSDWANPEDYVGRDGILVSLSAKADVEPACFDRWFESIEPLGTIEIHDGDMLLRKARVYRCRRQLMAFPFDRESLLTENPARALATRPADAERR